MSTVEVEPFEPGFFKYELNLLNLLGHKIEKIEEDEKEVLETIDEDIKHKDLCIVSDLMKILNKCYEDQKKIFVEKFGNDPRYLKYLQSIASRAPRAQTPYKFDPILINFFQSLDMGNGPSNVRFQDEPQCEVYFKEGFARLTSLVSLFNVWSNQYKLNNKVNFCKLTSEQRSIIATALDHIISKYRKTPTSSSEQDIKDLEEGILKNKDYMSILAFYTIKNEVGSHVIDKSYEEKVNTMSKLTKETNDNLHSKLSAMKLNKN